MPPAHTLRDHLLLHQLVGDCPLLGTFQHEIAARWGMPRRVADDALAEVPHLLGRDRTSDGKRQKPWRYDGYQVHSEPLELLFYALAGGAILYVVGEIWTGMRRYGHKQLGLCMISGGFLVGVATDLIVSYGGG